MCTLRVLPSIHRDRNQSYRICVRNFTKQEIVIRFHWERRNRGKNDSLAFSSPVTSFVHIYRTLLRDIYYIRNDCTFFSSSSHFFQLSNIFCKRGNRKFLPAIQLANAIKFNKAPKKKNELSEQNIETVNSFSCYLLYFQYSFL